jgi:hypothetical protein
MLAPAGAAGCGNSFSAASDDGGPEGTDSSFAEESTTPVPQEGGAADGTGPGDPADSSPCPRPDVTHGVFVEPGGAAGSCGDPSRPCPTIAAALDVVGRSGGTRTLVYLSADTFTEQVTLLGGVTMQGGWHDAGGTWTRNCMGKPASVVQAPAGVASTVIANYAGSSTLDSLTLASMDGGSVAPGQSVYGVFATGSSTRLILEDVHIEVAGGGAGAAGGGGADGASGGAAGSCAPNGNGATGVAGAAGRPGASSYGPGGFAPGAGGDGAAGSAGSNGTQPTTPPVCANAATGCVPQPGKTGAVGCTCGVGPLSSCGTAGTFGCAGAGSAGGSGGGGGGASIGVFAWGATVMVTSGTVTTGPGGAGGNGGPPGTPGAGTAGAAGSPPTLSIGLGICTGVASVPGLSACAACTQGFAEGKPGGPGGAGGTGGRGAQGGGGAGGDSYCFFQGGGGSVDVDPSVACTRGAAGPGGNQGSAGQGPSGASGLHN